MSIFKDTFIPEVKDQLTKRSESLTNRTPQSIQYLNSRNAWIKMSSSVNIYKSGDINKKSSYSNELAKAYVLQGGTLDPNNKLKGGIGSNFNNNAYSNIAYDGTAYLRGIRPMPGITSLSVEPKSAYGSLRIATVNFVCWDIKQLEDLELLYMRPGYTVLVEWGWTPYINNKGEYITNPIPYNFLDYERKIETIFADLFQKSKDHDGNYDSIFGFIKNYSWSVRMDGGYDCRVDIVSIGEIMESLKVNYTEPKINGDVNFKGIWASGLSGVSIDNKKLKESYGQNKLAGIWYELYNIAKSRTNNNWYKLFDRGINKNLNFFVKNIEIKGKADNSDSITDGNTQVYITLESLVDVLNKYVLLADGNTTLARLSTKERTYDKLDKTEKPLLCLAHPLQISVDPTVCLIKANLWYNGFIAYIADGSVNNGSDNFRFNTPLSDAEIDNIIDNLVYVSISTNKLGDEGKNTIIKYIKNKINGDQQTSNQLSHRFLERLKDLNFKVVKPANFDTSFNSLVVSGNLNNSRINKNVKTFVSTLYSLLSTNDNANLSTTQIDEAFGFNNSTDYNHTILITDPAITKKEKLAQEKNDYQKQVTYDKGDIEWMKKMDKEYFLNGDWKTELGIIENIYVNVDMLYKLSINKDLADSDKKEKKEINLYDYIKNILSAVNSAIGNVANLDIHIDNNVGRIIDINYVDNDTRKNLYTNAYQIEVHNLLSYVRSYSLESKIFPEQGTIVAIGAQVQGGALGVDAGSLTAFNRKIWDRNIPEKTNPPLSLNKNEDPEAERQAKLKALAENLKSLKEFITALEVGWFTDSAFHADKVSGFEGALRDIINYYKEITAADSKNRAIIPTSLSLEMDGIGGLVIGHVFKLPPSVLPKGYRGDEGGVGSKLGYTVTKIHHDITANDWKTKIEGQTIILDDPLGNALNFKDLTTTNSKGETQVATQVIATTSKNSTTMMICGKLRHNGEIDDILVPIRPDLYKRHWSPICQSDNKRIRLQPEAMKALEQLLIDAYSQGIYLKVNSAYRTYDDQVRIRQTATLPSATPGRSNHGFGLAVDLANVGGGRVNPNTTPKEWKWLQSNQQKYGFKNLDNSNESHHYNFIKPGKIC
jgi:hypothetical protein